MILGVYTCAGLIKYSNVIDCIQNLFNEENLVKCMFLSNRFELNIEQEFFLSLPVQ